VTAICLLAVAVGITWTAPIATPTKPLVQVILPTGSFCGELLSAADGNLLLKNGKIQLIPLTRVLAINLVTTCN
jgi:hypothetical protein